MQSFSSSLFQTASGKRVNVSSAELVKAQTLLGLDGHSNQFTDNNSEALGKSVHLAEKPGGHSSGFVTSGTIPICSVDYSNDLYASGNHLKKEVQHSGSGSEMHNSSTKPPGIKFQTAGGRSISISNDALQRARSLLGDSEFSALPNEGGLDSPGFSFVKEKAFNKTSQNKENDPYASYCLNQDTTISKYFSNDFLPPKGPFTKYKQLSTSSSNPGDYLFNQVDENGISYKGVCMTNSNRPCVQEPSMGEPCAPDMVGQNSLAEDIGSRMNPLGRLPNGALIDISNNIGTASRSEPRAPHIVVGNSSLKDIGSRLNPTGRPPSWPLVETSNSIGAAHGNLKQVTSEKRRFGGSSISPFKRPRSSRSVLVSSIY